MIFANHLAEHVVKMLAQSSLRNVVLARNKYLIVTSDAFLLQSNVFKRIVSVQRYACYCHGKGYYGPCIAILSLQNPRLIIIS